MSGFSRSDLNYTGNYLSSNRRERQGTEIPIVRTKRDVENSEGRREKNGLRPIFLRIGTVEKAAGSAYIEAGRSKVMCAVYGPRPDSRAAHFHDTGRIHCNIRFAPFCGLAGTVAEKLEKDLPSLIGPALETAVLLTRYPKSVIEIFLLVLEVEGDISSMAISCSSVALADAGIEMYDLVASCSSVRTDRGLVVDPSRADLEQQTGYVLTALMPTRGEITALSQSGMWDGVVLQQGIDLALEGARQIHLLMRQALCEGLNKEAPEGASDSMVQ